MRVRPHQLEFHDFRKAFLSCWEKLFDAIVSLCKGTLGKLLSSEG